jgi:glucose-6-phosphate isomerase
MNLNYDKSKYIFIFGIGGSNLASKAIWDAITLHKNNDKRVFFVESPDNREYEEIENLIKNEINDKEEIAFVATSKSGETTETLFAFRKVFEMMVEKFGDEVSGRGVAITTSGTELHKLAEEKNIEFISWEGDVGGRFSAFTVAHTLVLEILRLDAESFVSGGNEANLYDASQNSADNLAKTIFDEYNAGKNILDFFFFNSELESLGKWARQLVAESLGKENIDGQKVGIVPTVSIGPTDLHSMLQLALGGPQNRFTIFVRSIEETKGGVNEEAFNDVMSGYKNEGLGFFKYEMKKIEEKEIGKFMAFMILVVLELGTLLGVDPYGQEEVERYKKRVHKGAS